MRKCLFIALHFLAFNHVYAQQTDTAIHETTKPIKHIAIDEVRVIGIGPQKLSTKEAVVVTSEDISVLNTIHFSTVVEQLPGIVKISEATFPLIIRGMYGSRIYVEKNGMIKTGVDQSGYTLEDVNPDDVSDVQLIHGARSVAYGSGSMGGVLLINEKLQFGETGFRSSLKMGYGTNSNEKMVNLRTKYRNSNNVLKIGLRYTNSDDFHYPNNVRAYNSAITYKNASIQYAHLFSKKLLVEWDNEFYSGERQKPLGFQNNPYDYRTFYDKYNFGSIIKLKKSISEKSGIQAQIWYNPLNTNQQQDEVNAGTKKLAISEVRYNFKTAAGFKTFLWTTKWKKWKTEAGIDGHIDYLKQDWEITDVVHHTHNYYKNNSSQMQDIGGLYAIGEYTNENNIIGLSVRGDVGALHKDSIHSETYKSITGGADWKYEYKPWLIPTLSLSRHFRFPIPMETIGIFYGGRGTFVGNPNIEPESCYNLELTLNGTIKHINYSINGWSSFFFNRISEQMLFTNKYTFVNIDKSRLFGIDGSVTSSFGNKNATGMTTFSVSSSYSIGDDVSENGFFKKGTPLEGIPPGRSKAKVQYTKTIGKVEPSIFLIYTYFSAYNRLPEYAVTKTWGQNERPAYSLFDAGVNLNFPLYLNGITASLLVNNLFDKQYQPYGSYLYGIGRNIKLTVIVKF